MGLSGEEQRILTEIEEGCQRRCPELVAYFRGKLGRRLCRNSLERQTRRQEFKIAILASAAGIGIVILVLAAFLVFVHFHPLHMPDVPYTGGYLGSK